MKQHLKDILSHTHKELEDQQLIDYVSGKLQHQEKHEMEAQMVDDPFLEDAMEGLSSLPHTQDAAKAVASLKKNLQAQLHQKKEKRRRRTAGLSNWTLVAIIVILLTLFVSYFVIRLF